MDNKEWQCQPEDEKLRALLLSLRYINNEIKGIRSEILRSLVQTSKDNAWELYESISRLLFDQQHIDRSFVSQLINKSMITIMGLREHGISVLMIPDDEYPKRFTTLKDAPFILFAKGNLAALNPDKSIAVIGTRNADDSIYNTGIEISIQLAHHGWMVASGLAKGCDSAGHIGCIRGKGITTAILPSSIEKIYPSDNRGLAEEIVANDGCLLTEYLSSDQIQRYFFVQRDRLQAAIADNLLVLQTGIKGGTMHTVRFANLYNKKVFTYMPSVDLPPQVDISGNKELLCKKKAIGFTNIDTLLECLEVPNSESDNALQVAASIPSETLDSSGENEQLEIPGL